MITLQVWRSMGQNPCHNPPHSLSPVYISIAPVEERTWVFPWVLPLERAVEIFGEEIVKQVTETPTIITLDLKFR